MVNHNALWIVVQKFGWPEFLHASEADTDIVRKARSFYPRPVILYGCPDLARLKKTTIEINDQEITLHVASRPEDIGLPADQHLQIPENAWIWVDNACLGAVDENIIVMPPYTTKDQNKYRDAISIAEGEVISKALETLSIPERPRQEISTAFFLSEAKAVVSGALEDIKTRERALIDQIRSYVDTLNNLNSSLGELRLLMSATSAGLEQKAQKIVEEVQEARQNGLCEDACLVDNSLWFLTPPIVAEGVYLGRYLVKWSPAEKDLRIYAAEKTWEADCQHPHIALDGMPCYGNVGGVLFEALSEFRLLDALSLIYRILTEINHESVYTPLSNLR